MELIMTIILLLVCLLISNVISHNIPFIPTALTQIAFGIIIALVFQNFSLEIETDWFLLLFIAPLLYNDGRHFPRRELWKMRKPILGNAIVLVLLTTIGGGYFIHWMIPTITLAAAFALAAILSPTDPVAVNGIAKRIQIPDKVLNLVRGESLINDASGLVAFNYAVAAVVTGYFSLREAVFDFTYMFIVGAILGLILGLLVTWIRFTLRKHGINDVTFHSLLQLLTPFIIYIITDELLGASGVIAVVVAGIVHTLVREKTETLVAEEQVLTENLWSIVLFVLNGIVFLLLGLNIPSSMEQALESPAMNDWLIVGYVIAIGMIILGIRFIWSYLSASIAYHRGRAKNVAAPDLKTALYTSLTGVRGAVTMAGVLSLPFFVESGDAFPARFLILFLAAGVILFTLIVATVFLPILSASESGDGITSNQLGLSEARQKLLQATVNAIHAGMNEENASASYELIDEYKLMFHQTDDPKKLNEKDSSSYQLEMTRIRLRALKIERKYIYDVMRKNGMDETVFETFETILDHREEALSNNARSGIKYLTGKIIRAWKQMGRYHRTKDEKHLAKIRLARDIQINASRTAIKKLETYKKEYERKDIINEVISDYKRMINKLKTRKSRFSEKNEEQKEALRIEMMDKQRAKIHEMYVSGEISGEQTRELRRFVNYMEAVTLYEHVE
jgi:CPA1 family monovalent cation:H+ antiporter